MNKRTDIWRCLLLPLLILAGCIEDEMHCPSAEEETTYPYVVLRIAVPSETTRSNPMGGEEGNGREQGVLNEDEIHNINVFFYNHEDGLDAPDNTPILYSIYYNLKNSSDPDNSVVSYEWKDEDAAANPYVANRYLELSFPGNSTTSDFAAGIKFAVVAKTGKLTASDIGTLRDMRLTKSSDGFDAKSADCFVMTTAFNREYRYGGKTTGTNTLAMSGKNFSGTTTIERMLGRIDLWYNANENAGISPETGSDAKIGNLSYEIEDTENLLLLTNILPVNVMQRPSFMFKKVTAIDEQPGNFWTVSNLKNVQSFSWAGKELPDGVPVSNPDLPTNYVIEPTTLQKEPGGSKENSTSWFGETSADNVKASILDPENGRISEFCNMRRIKGENDPDYKCDRISIISYANENTHPVDCFRGDYLTGLAIRGHYVPKHIYSAYAPASENNTEKQLTELTETEREAFSDGGKIWRYSPSAGSTVKESGSLYFSNEEALDSYRKAHPDDNPIVTGFSAGHVDGKLGVVCYYNLWLRHYNDETADPQQTYPMEYAIVRNNIYRVALEFTGPGDPEPTMREPDTMQARIFVRKWNQRKENDPLQF